MHQAALLPVSPPPCRGRVCCAMLLALTLTPALAAAQGQTLPPQPPIVATPLMPPSVQYAPQQPPSVATDQQPPAPPSAQAPPPSQPPSPAPPGQSPQQGQSTAPAGQPTSPGAAPATPGQAQPPASGEAAAPQPAPPLPNIWQPQGSAVLQLLDKVNAQTSTVTVKVGQSINFGTLSIAVQACAIRPPDQPQDATAFLTITDSHADQPGFKGWMLRSDPELSMLQHPIYDVRVVGCAP